MHWTSIAYLAEDLASHPGDYLLGILTRTQGAPVQLGKYCAASEFGMQYLMLREVSVHLAVGLVATVNDTS